MLQYEARAKESQDCIVQDSNRCVRRQQCWQVVCQHGQDGSEGDQPQAKPGWRLTMERVDELKEKLSTLCTEEVCVLYGWGHVFCLWARTCVVAHPL